MRDRDHPVRGEERGQFLARNPCGCLQGREHRGGHQHDPCPGTPQPLVDLREQRFAEANVVLAESDRRAVGPEQVVQLLGGRLPVVPGVAEEDVPAVRVGPRDRHGLPGQGLKGALLGGCVCRRAAAPSAPRRRPRAATATTAGRSAPAGPVRGDRWGVGGVRGPVRRAVPADRAVCATARSSVALPRGCATRHGQMLSEAADISRARGSGATQPPDRLSRMHGIWQLSGTVVPPRDQRMMWSPSISSSSKYSPHCGQMPFCRSYASRFSLSSLSPLGRCRQGRVPPPLGASREGGACSGVVPRSPRVVRGECCRRLEQQARAGGGSIRSPKPQVVFLELIGQQASESLGRGQGVRVVEHFRMQERPLMSAAMRALACDGRRAQAAV